VKAAQDLCRRRFLTSLTALTGHPNRCIAITSAGHSQGAVCLRRTSAVRQSLSANASSAHSTVAPLCRRRFPVVAVRCCSRVGVVLLISVKPITYSGFNPIT
jgi:hypothetical protein